MPKRHYLARALALVALLIVSACSPGAVPSVLGDNTGNLAGAVPNLPTVNDLFAVEPITTSFDDVYTEADLAVATNTFTDLRTMPRSADGSYQLTPGLYQLAAQSFCLKAGTHGPSEGSGYLPAPLEGDRRDIVYKILNTYADNPSVTQRNAQVLIWAIIARTSFTDMSPGIQATATRLLNQQELLALSNGALGLVPDQVWNTLLQQVPQPVRQIYNAERNLRTLANRAGSSYETFEDVAVLAGAAPDADQIRNVPRGQWAEHPGGYLVRYFPSGYSSTRVEIFVSETRPSVVVDLSETVATPANTSAQRLGIGTPAR
ncbi:MAG: hypothetical protein U5L04_07640 [Trueperaceae bacterium]|nr:hypothetical protein [Trueperaceae bacterium]